MYNRYFCTASKASPSGRFGGGFGFRGLMADKRTDIIFRFGAVYFIIVLAFVAVIAKIISIQTERDEWLALHERYAERASAPILARRGNIYCSNGGLMASTIPTYRVFMDMNAPQLRHNNLFLNYVDSLAIALANFFGDRTASQYRNDLMTGFRNGNGRHVIVPREITHSEWLELQTFPIFRRGVGARSGLIFEKRIRRVQPFGSLASRTIGNVFPDERGGRSGLEHAHNEALAGTPGVGRQQRMGRGWRQIIEVMPIDGKDVVTTIDIDIQDIAESELVRMLRSVNARSGYAVVMETSTGRVRAIVNMYRDARGGFYERENGALTDLMEPGSTFKTMVLMALLEDGKVRLDDVFDTGNGRMTFAGRELTDHNWRRGGFGQVTVAEILHGSSNIGMHQMVMSAYGNTPDTQRAMIDRLRAMNFTQAVDLGIHGAGVPFVNHPENTTGRTAWSRTSMSAISRGYEVQIPAIYMLMFYNAIANGGRMVAPRFVEEIQQNGRTVRRFRTEVVNPSIASRSTINYIHEALLGVVEGDLGTARNMRSNTVRIAGKTGTARMTNAQGANRHRVSFAGYFPADNPQYSAIVVVNEPAIASPSAGQISGGVFLNIAERTMALRTNLTPQIIASDSVRMANVSLFPNSTNGNFQDLRTITRGLRLPVSGETGEWVRTSVTESGIYIEPIEITEGQIPDVRGMGARDAVYLLGKMGLNVQINGRGRVVSQSVTPGTPAARGRTVVLNLR